MGNVCQHVVLMTLIVWCTMLAKTTSTGASKPSKTTQNDEREPMIEHKDAAGRQEFGSFAPPCAGCTRLCKTIVLLCGDFCCLANNQ